MLRTLREITEIKELTPTLVNTLIELIEVHNNDKSSGHCYVKVDVYFTAVGMIDIPTEQEIIAMMEETQKILSIFFLSHNQKTVQPISELHRKGIKPKHPYVTLAFDSPLFTLFFPSALLAAADTIPLTASTDFCSFPTGKNFFLHTICKFSEGYLLSGL